MGSLERDVEAAIEKSGDVGRFYRSVRDSGTVWEDPGRRGMPFDATVLDAAIKE